MNHSDQALSRIAWEYRNSTKFKQLIDTLPSIAQNSLEAVFQEIYDVLDIDNANAWQLNVIGSIVNQSRDSSILSDDENYRVAIKAKIAQNNSDATIDGIRNAVEFVISSTVFEIIDNFDMSFLISLESPLSETVKSLLQSIQIIPRPQGVRLTGLINPEQLPVFGFSELNTGESLAVVDGFGEINSEYAFSFDDETVLEILGDGILSIADNADNLTGPGGHFAELYEVF